MAGPVVAAAVLVESLDVVFDPRITDSKKINSSLRTELSLQIRSHFRTSIGVATAEEIDKMNILNASLLAMKRAVQGLDLKASPLLLVDGVFKIPGLSETEQICLVKGDLRCTPIGAASIVAKVYRDQQMESLAKVYPEYGFDGHKGYATPFHKDQILKYGTTPIHRKTFKGSLPGSK